MKKPDWTGRTVICIASGSSLSEEDCEIARKSGHIVIVTNTTFKLCPWADMLFGFDAKWWKIYREEVGEFFKGQLVSYSQAVKHLGVESTFRAQWFTNYGNSGACAIGIAIAAGADKIVLLGYDCSVEGKTHWHGDHPQGLTNCDSIKRWPAQFRAVADDAKKEGVEVLNASRNTALKCFQRVELGDVV